MYKAKESFMFLAEEMKAYHSYYLAQHTLVVRELQNAHGLMFFLAIEPEKNRRLLLVPITKELGTLNLKQFSACRGTAVAKDRFEKIGPLADQSCLIIRQTGPETHIFEAFAADVLDRLWSSGPAEVLPTIRKAMHQWQEFFSKASDRGLSGEQQRGLYGELAMLRTLLEQGSDPDIVTAWQGPLREDVDFLFGNTALEVKTTQSLMPIQVTISNEHQLSCEEYRHLFLGVVFLQVSERSGETLVQIVSDLRTRFAEWASSLRKFNDLLIQAGYHDLHAETYQDTRYAVVERKYYRVANDFPRISPSMLPNGVTHVRYDIILDGYGKHEVDQKTVIHVVQGYDE